MPQRHGSLEKKFRQVRVRLFIDNRKMGIDFL
jgi:hypothetical protein